MQSAKHRGVYPFTPDGEYQPLGTFSPDGKHRISSPYDNDNDDASQ
jgi:hypothetical protein